METTFGEFLKAKRLGRNLSLREFAKLVAMQPSNYCNVESGGLPPPPDAALDRMANALGIKKGTQDYATFYDLAAKGRDEIPADVAKIVRKHPLIPAMLRTVENEKVTERQLRGIMEDLKSGRYKEAPSHS
ncbi:MAG: transcriptional regulator [Verrucomicrobia bacterium]|nr:transcriptional regulator [Verrucomicrobiota bacterium]